MYYGSEATQVYSSNVLQTKLSKSSQKGVCVCNGTHIYTDASGAPAGSQGRCEDTVLLGSHRRAYLRESVVRKEASRSFELIVGIALRDR